MMYFFSPGGVWWSLVVVGVFRIRTSSLLLRLGSRAEDWQEHFVRQRKQFYDGEPGWCWQPDILMSHISHLSFSNTHRRTTHSATFGQEVRPSVKMV